MSSKNKKNSKEKSSPKSSYEIAFNNIIPSGLDLLQLPSENDESKKATNLIDLVSLVPNKTKNIPPAFVLEIGVPANNIGKQLIKQKIQFDPSVIKTYDNLLKGIVKLKKEKFISSKKSQKLIYSVYERAVKHVYFVYEMIDDLSLLDGFLDNIEKPIK